MPSHSSPPLFSPHWCTGPPSHTDTVAYESPDREEERGGQGRGREEERRGGEGRGGEGKGEEGRPRRGGPGGEGRGRTNKGGDAGCECVRRNAFTS